MSTSPPKVMIGDVEYRPVALVDANTLHPSLGAALRALRESCGLTLEDASFAAGCAKSHLWSLERDVSMPGLDLAATLARTYGVSVDWLAGHTNRKE